MILNYEEIKSENLIIGSDDDFFDNASYDLRVEKIICVDGTENTKVVIKPNSMVVVVSQETLDLPKNRIGHAFIKTRLSQTGLMANNIGIIDPKYKGKISTVLTNFGKNDYVLKKNDVFLRVTISSFKEPKVDISLDFPDHTDDSYYNMIKAKTQQYLGCSFIDIENEARLIKEEVTRNHEKEREKKIRRNNWRIATWGIVVACIGVILNAILVINKNDKYDRLKEEVIKMQDEFYHDDASRKKVSKDIKNLYTTDGYLDEKIDKLSSEKKTNDSK